MRWLIKVCTKHRVLPWHTRFYTDYDDESQSFMHRFMVKVNVSYEGSWSKSMFHTKDHSQSQAFIKKSNNKNISFRNSILLNRHVTEKRISVRYSVSAGTEKACGWNGEKEQHKLLMPWWQKLPSPLPHGAKYHRLGEVRGKIHLGLCSVSWVRLIKSRLGEGERSTSNSLSLSPDTAHWCLPFLFPGGVLLAFSMVTWYPQHQVVIWIFKTSIPRIWSVKLQLMRKKAIPLWFSFSSVCPLLAKNVIHLQSKHLILFFLFFLLSAQWHFPFMNFRSIFTQVHHVSFCRCIFSYCTSNVSVTTSFTN